MGSKGALFRYADGVDKLLLFFGTLGCMGDGQQTPLTMLLLSSIVEEYAAHGVKHSLSHHTVNKYTLRLIYLAFGVGVSSFIEGVCWTRTAERQTSRMRTEYLSAILRQEVGFFDNNSTSTSAFQVISTVSSDVQVIQDTMAEKIPNFLANMSSFVSSIVVGFILSWRLGISSFPFSILMILPAIIYGAKLKDLGEKIKDAYGVAGGIAEQSISSIRTVYSYVGENQTMKRFSSALEKSMQLGFKQGFGKGLVIGSLGLMYATWAFLSWVGSVLVTQKQENGGRVFMGEICAIWGGLSLMSALPNLTFMLEAAIAATRICEMIDRIPSINSEEKKGKILKDFRGEITFNAVDFSYPSRPEKLILRRLDLHVKAGKTVGLVGGSGSGKSTIFSLLQRFYDPTNGDILLDRHSIKKLQIQWLRSCMGLVNQEPILFATSIKENILFGKEEATVEEMISATKAANAHEFISKLPDGYDTQVGQFGVQLSGGQKQRIAIARALIRDPKILLLDEATSALDAQSEKVVQDALDMASRGRTTLIIAHRLSTVQKADVLVVLQSGRVVESGSHDHLMQRNNGRGGIYSEMVRMQQLSTENGTSYQLKLESRSIPHTPVRKILSSQSSPATPFSPAYSIDIPDSSLEYSEESLTKSGRSSSFQWRLLRMNAPEWKHMVLGCLGAIGSGMVLPINSYCLGAVVSVYFVDDDSILKKEIRSYSYIFLTLTVVSFISSLLQHYNFAIMGERLMKRTREMVLAKVLTFEIGWFDKDENSSASISARLATESSLVRSLVAERMSLLVQVFFNASLAYILSFVLAWRLAIVMVAMQPFIISCFYSKNIFMKRMSRKAQKAQGESSQLAMEATIHHRTITAFSSQKRILTLFEIALKGPRKESVKMAWISGLVLSFSQFLTTASIAFTFWYGGILVNQNIVKAKQLYQVFFILMGTGKGIADAGTMTSDIAKSGKAIRSVFAILDRMSLIHPEDSSGEKVRKALRGDIEINNVFFSYPARPDHLILQGLTLKIKAGKTIALVGPSGCGKSTIIGLIERFYDPTRGTILIDGCDVKTYNLRSLRSHIGLVSQEPTLFAGTIRDNIAYGNENAAESEIKKAANLANADDFISSMKDGYSTWCGERGVQLSGGQKQRIAIARAILKNPEILLLDEATSALDSVSENIIQETLEKMMVGRTCIIIAHRLSTIQNADSIAVLKNGKVVELGSHSDLISNKPNGAYSSMIRLQNNRSARTTNRETGQ